MTTIQVFPARAGMSRRPTMTTLYTKSVPRASGDEPLERMPSGERL